MFHWYQDSEVCYVYLSDVDMAGKGRRALKDELAQSKWFTRGWTLQELIAPRDLLFLDRLGTVIGTRSKYERVIERVTGIEAPQDFHPSFGIRDTTIAKRMSWASRRETTREEDMAYCLMGLFDVNMPLLYGEGGRKAFYRLQLEILKRSDDETIFLWNQDWFCSNSKSTELRPRIDSVFPLQASPFASSPELFRSSSNFQTRPLFRKRDDYSTTNKGLYINLTQTLIYESEDGLFQLMVTPLNCPVFCPGLLEFVMYLLTFEENRSRGSWYRWGPVHPAKYDFNVDKRRIYISDRPDNDYRFPHGPSGWSSLWNSFERMKQVPEFHEMFKPLYDYLDSCPQPAPCILPA